MTSYTHSVMPCSILIQHNHSEPEYFEQFDFIITANLPISQLLPLAQYCWQPPSSPSRSSIPMIAVKSYGLIGSLRLQLRHHSIVESRLENDSFDLRIAAPFKELHAYCSSFDLETSRTDTFTHSHIPYVVILYKAIDMWRSQVS